MGMIPHARRLKIVGSGCTRSGGLLTNGLGLLRRFCGASEAPRRWYRYRTDTATLGQPWMPGPSARVNIPAYSARLPAKLAGDGFLIQR
jgi:hypothetical protein